MSRGWIGSTAVIQEQGVGSVAQDALSHVLSLDKINEVRLKSRLCKTKYRSNVLWKVVCPELDFSAQGHGIQLTYDGFSEAHS